MVGMFIGVAGVLALSFTRAERRPGGDRSPRLSFLGGVLSSNHVRYLPPTAAETRLDEPGVYLFRDKGGKVIYVGRPSR